MHRWRSCTSRMNAVVGALPFDSDGRTATHSFAHNFMKKTLGDLRRVTGPPANQCSSLMVRMRTSMPSMVLSSRGVKENHSGLLGTQQRSG
ncbi:hypothetical protein EYF80_037842 [Liparis tanakae]|uniref:Uncharacterized protein n=1 Tax=Liparis tanakae TaxID=230148 RepID=A0A4Z2GFI9_9TELE|nr:hypothetical protein EYF80_037842 [Liparis tanakae]